MKGVFRLVDARRRRRRYQSKINHINKEIVRIILADCPDNLDAQVMALLDAGEWVACVEHVRKQTGLSVRESHDVMVGIRNRARGE